MKISRETIGPVPYFGGMAFVILALPYVWGVPSVWPVCVPLSVAALCFFVYLVRKEEKVLRTAKRGDPAINQVVMVLLTLTFANTMFIRFYQ
jgi:hypothetical protein